MLLVQGGEKLSMKKPSGLVETELLDAIWAVFLDCLGGSSREVGFRQGAVKALGFCCVFSRKEFT